MPCARRCQISDETFGGFHITVDLDYYYDTKEVSNYVQSKLVGALEQLHLGHLVAEARNKKFHIHDYDIYDLRKRKEDAIVYICAHC